MIEGQNVSLECDVYGNPVPDVRWTKDGGAVNITDPRISVSFTGNASSLTIVSVVQVDQGPYRCVANNSMNTVTSYPGTLKVYCEFLIAFSFTGYLIDHIRNRGIEMELQCSLMRLNIIKKREM